MARASTPVACSTLLLRLRFRFGLIRNAGLFGRDNTLNDNRLGRLLLRRHLNGKKGFLYKLRIRFLHRHLVNLERVALLDVDHGRISLYCGG